MIEKTYLVRDSAFGDSGYIVSAFIIFFSPLMDSSLPARRWLLEYNLFRRACLQRWIMNTLCGQAFRMTNGVCDLGAVGHNISSSQNPPREMWWALESK